MAGTKGESLVYFYSLATLHNHNDLSRHSILTHMLQLMKLLLVAMGLPGQVRLLLSTLHFDEEYCLSKLFGGLTGSTRHPMDIGMPHY